MRKKKGQSILEYVIVLTVIVVAIAFGAKAALKPALEAGMQNAEESVRKATGNLAAATDVVGP